MGLIESQLSDDSSANFSDMYKVHRFSAGGKNFDKIISCHLNHTHILEMGLDKSRPLSSNPLTTTSRIPLVFSLLFKF